MTEHRAIQAAGAALWRGGSVPGGGNTVGGNPVGGNGTVEVALVHRPRYDDWSLPKGKLNTGEHAVTAALREVAEETGYTVRLGRPLPTAHYLTTGRPKRVRYWAATPLTGAFTPSSEVDELVWLSLPQARERLTQPRDAAVLDALITAPWRTAPVIVLRHATSRGRNDWSGEDADRPLADQGTAEARALPLLLAAYRPDQVVSSPARRCLDTVRPYSLMSGTPVTIEPLLSEVGFLAAPQAARTAVARLAAAAPGGILLCTHRPVIPTLLTTVGLAGAGPRLRPGEFAVIHRTGEQVVAVERHVTVASR